MPTLRPLCTVPTGGASEVLVLADPTNMFVLVAVLALVIARAASRNKQHTEVNRQMVYGRWSEE